MMVSAKFSVHLLSGLFLLLLLVPGAKAASLYSYPFDNLTAAKALWSIHDIHQQICADDFMVQGSNAVVEKLTFWVVLGDPVTIPSAFKVTFYESTANGYPDSLIQETPWRTDFTCEDTGEEMFAGKVYELTITLSGSQQLAVISDTRYWVGLQAQTTDGYVYSGMGTKITGDMACIWLGLENKWVTTYDASPWGASDIFFAVSGTIETSLENSTWGAIKNAF